MAAAPTSAPAVTVRNPRFAASAAPATAPIPAANATPDAMSCRGPGSCVTTPRTYGQGRPELGPIHPQGRDGPASVLGRDRGQGGLIGRRVEEQDGCVPTPGSEVEHRRERAGDRDVHPNCE